MALNIIITLVVLFALIIGSLTDLKKREVPDWLNYSLIFSGFGLRLILSAAREDFTFILEGLLGFLAVVVVAYIMFYAGQWGGGDAKMLMGLGALIGLELAPGSLLVAFILNSLVIGAFYGLLWSTALAVLNRKRFARQLKKLTDRPAVRKIRSVIRVSALVLFVLVFFLVEDLALKLPLLSVVALGVLVFYVWIFVKTVENAFMFRKVVPEKLTEGDWIPKDVIVDGKRICGPKDLGIEMNQIQKLIKLRDKGKISRVLIKEGIPFVPSFLIAFIISYFAGNILFLVI